MGDTPKGIYSLSLKGEGFSIAREVDQTTARAIVDLVLGGGSSIAVHQERERGGTKDGPVMPPSSSRLSVREFLDSTEAKRNPDKIVAIGEYILAHDGQVDFTKGDVKSRFRIAGESPPANYPRDFNWTISNGWIAEDLHNRGHYYVTQKGKSAIAAKFSSDIKKRSGIKAGGRRRTRRTAQ
jgi:hypothetical protein